MSVLLPLAEIAGGICILVPRTKTLGACLLLTLCLIFIAALGWALANGIVVDCSCFGQEQRPSAAKMSLALVRDVFLAMLAIIVLFKDRSKTPGRTRLD